MDDGCCDGGDEDGAFVVGDADGVLVGNVDGVLDGDADGIVVGNAWVGLSVGVSVEG